MKLIRDRIPEIARAHGDELRVRTLNSKEFILAALDKVVEEAQELRSAPDRESRITEAADVLEALSAVLAEAKIAQAEVAVERNRRLNERGGFAKRLLLMDD